MAIADVFDALTMKRPYKDAWPITKAFDEIRKGRGQHFDPRLLDCFFDHQLDILELKEEWDEKEKLQLFEPEEA